MTARLSTADPSNLSAAPGQWPGVFEAYRGFLPATEATPTVTLSEGNTPLLPLPSVARQIGRGVRVFAKYDGLNPTGSFKDRGMSVTISKAQEAGAQAVICASTGNTSASAAAYASRAGLRTFVLVPEGYVALGKLAQALVYGAEVLAIDGNFDTCLHLVKEMAERYPVTLVNSINPYRLQGQKTAAFEVVDGLGDSPDWLAIPVGNAGNISAYWMGFCEYHSAGYCHRLPHMMGFQSEGAAPTVSGAPVTSPQTVATAIRIGNPANWQSALDVRAASQGAFDRVSDAAILDAYRWLGAQEGIFCEPASATAIAGLLKVKDRIPSNATVVCVLTGNGLKDPDCAIQYSQAEVRSGIAPNGDAVARAMGF